MKKEKILKILLGKIGDIGIQNLDSANVLSIIGISQKQFNMLFSDGAEELLMDSIEYAGCQWLDHLKKDVKEAESKTEKIALVLNGYALGAEKFSENLSLYIDLWKMVKDGKHEYLKKRLNKIYEMYSREFTEIMDNIGVGWLTKEEIYVWGVLMTALSDAIHIQFFTMKNSVDFMKIQHFIGKVTKTILPLLEERGKEMV